MGEQIKIDHPEKYTIGDKLTAAAQTPQQKSWLKRIAAAKVPDDKIEVGVTEMPTGLTKADLAKWAQENRGKQFVVPEVRISVNDLQTIFSEETVSDLERQGAIDDLIAQRIVKMLVQGVTRENSETGQMTYTFVKPVEVKDQ
jgi:hypothetical protein